MSVFKKNKYGLYDCLQPYCKRKGEKAFPTAMEAGKHMWQRHGRKGTHPTSIAATKLRKKQKEEIKKMRRKGKEKKLKPVYNISIDSPSKVEHSVITPYVVIAVVTKMLNDGVSPEAILESLDVARLHS